MEESWKNVIGILYQDILGSHEEKVSIITKWLTDISDTHNVSQYHISHTVWIRLIVEQYTDYYNRKS